MHAFGKEYANNKITLQETVNFDDSLMFKK